MSVLKSALRPQAGVVHWTPALHSMLVCRHSLQTTYAICLGDAPGLKSACLSCSSEVVFLFCVCVCRKRGIRYVQHPHLFAILVHFTECLRQLGCAPDMDQTAVDAAVIVSSKKNGKKQA